MLVQGRDLNLRLRPSHQTCEQKMTWIVGGEWMGDSNLSILKLLDSFLPSEGRGHKFESCRVRQPHKNLDAAGLNPAPAATPFHATTAASAVLYGGSRFGACRYKLRERPSGAHRRRATQIGVQNPPDVPPKLPGPGRNESGSSSARKQGTPHNPRKASATCDETGDRPEAAGLIAGDAEVMHQRDDANLRRGWA